MSELLPVPRRLVPPDDYVVYDNPAGDYSAEGTSDSGGLKEYLGIIRRHLLLVLGAALLGSGLAGYKAYTDPTEYRSSAVIRLTDNRGALAGALGGAALAPRGFGDPILSQMEILRSRSVTGRVVDAEGLRLRPEDNDFPIGALQGVVVAPNVGIDSLLLRFGANGVTAATANDSAAAAYGAPLYLDGVQLMVAESPGVSEAVFRIVSRESAANQLQGDLITERRQGTDIVDVAYTAHDPIVAQRVVNSLVQNFQAFNASTAQEDAARRREFIEGQLQHTDSLLRSAQMAVAGFRSRNEVFSSREELVGRQVGLQELEVQRRELQADRDVYQTIVSRLRASGPEERVEGLQSLLATPDIAANPVVGALSTQLLGHQAVYDSLTAGEYRRSDTNPQVRQALSLIESTRVKLINAVSSHLNALQARLAVLDNLIGRGSAEMRSMPSTESEEVRLLAEVEYLGAIAAQLRQQYQQAQIEEAVQLGQVEIVDPALPGGAIAAGRIRTVLFGLVLGLMLGVGSAYARENLNTSIRRKDEVTKLLQIPELAVVPRFDGLAGRRGAARLLAAMGSRSNGNGRHPSVTGGELISAEHPQSTAAEAYRTLRTNLIFSQSMHPLRTLVVTSSAPSEGKSTTAANIAATFAQQGRRVLLVDCDLRKARLHKMFGVPREPGFTHLLLDLKEISEVVRPTAVEGLFFLSSGTLPPNPAEMVSGTKMHATLEELSREFDLVVIDTPPVLAASDAAIIGRVVDGVILVVRAGQTEREAARQALRHLVAGRARVLGAVLNDPDAKVGKYGGHFQYEYYGEKV